MSEKEAAPQDLAAKLEAIKGTPGKARCRLHHLQTRIGFKVLESDSRGPVLVEVYPMDQRLRWRRIGNEKEAWFEIET